eukprot:9894249-Lingulodinium_polyedra.AAC.1
MADHCPDLARPSPDHRPTNARPSPDHRPTIARNQTDTPKIRRQKRFRVTRISALRRQKPC